MDKRLIVWLLALLMLEGGALHAKPVVEQGGLQYETMRDEGETKMRSNEAFESWSSTQIVNLPELSAPLGITTDMMKSYPDASPLDGIQLVGLPQSNNRGDAELTYLIDLPAVRHDMKPELVVAYNSNLYGGNLGAGWNMNFPKITVDTVTEEISDRTFRCLGAKLHFKKENSDGTMVYYGAIKGSAFEAIKQPLEDEEEGNFWQLNFAGGIKRVFGLVHVAEDDKKKSEQEQKVVAEYIGEGDEKETVEWLITWEENQYGDYIEYVYDSKNCLDSIKMGVVGEERPRVIINLGWKSVSPSFEITRYGESYSWNRLLSDLNIYTIKDFRTANKLPKRESDYYESVKSYSFTYEQKDDLTAKLSALALIVDKKSYSHRFEYYDDRDSVEHYRTYRDLYFDFSVDSQIVDRTGLLKTMHTPLGGCVTIDYAYSEKAQIFGEEPISEGLSLDTLLAYKERRDSALIYYFHHNDTTKAKLVMSTFWLNDGIYDDGYASRNDFEYERPLADMHGRFVGFAKVSTISMNTETEGHSAYRRKVKLYDTTSVYTLPNVLSVRTETLSGELLSGTNYEYYSYKLALSSDQSSYRFVNSDLADYMPLKRKEFIRGEKVQDSWEYSYDESIAAPNPIDVKHLSNDGSIDKHLSYTYRRLLANPLTFLLASASLSDGEDKFKASVSYQYGDASNPLKVTKQIEKFGEGAEEITEFAYDADGNMIKRIMPGEKGQAVVYSYLYDQRYNMYPVEVQDNRGYKSYMDGYNYVLGKPTILIDRNYQEMRFSYDGLGRLTKVLGPNELSEAEGDIDNAYSIKYTYELPVPSNEASVCLPDLFSDSLVLDVPQEIWENTFSDSMKSEIFKKLFPTASSKSASQTNSSRLRASVSVTVQVTAEPLFEKYNFCEAGWPYDTLGIVVAKDSVNIPLCLCEDIATPSFALTTRAGAVKSERKLYADGFGRVIQQTEKKEIYETDGAKLGEGYVAATYHVSEGRSAFDTYGREVLRSRALKSEKSVYQPLVKEDESSYFAKFEYDSLDQIKRYVDHSGTEIVFDYNLEENLVSYGKDGFKSGSLRYGAFGELLSHSILLKGDPYVENYTYDPMGRLVGVDQAGRLSLNRYDSKGRLLESVRNGVTTKYTYDVAGNLLKQETGGKKIEYAYENGQLTTIHQDGVEDVRFVYGDKDAIHNRVGAIAMAIDATGVHEYYYGRQGELVKERRTVIIPDSTVETYTTQTEFDTWGRLLKVVYPDGEILSYTYAQGGYPKSAIGSKSYDYNYVSEAGYNEYGQNTFLAYCNGLKTMRGYDPATSRMTWMNVKNPAGDEVYSRNNIVGDEVITNYDGLTLSQTIYREMYGPINFDVTNLTDSVGVETRYSMTAHYSSLGLPYRYSQSFVKMEEGQNTILKSLTASPYFDEKGRLFCQSQWVDQGASIPATVLHYDAQGLVSGTADTELNSTDDISEDMPLNGHSVRTFVADATGHLLGMDDNGYLTNFWHSWDGDLTLQMAGGQQELYVNSQNALQHADRPTYELYLNKYFEKSGDSLYVKHIWFGDELVASKMGDNDSYGANPTRITRAGGSVQKVNYDSLYSVSQEGLVNRYANLNVDYNHSGKSCPSQAVVRSSNVDNGNDNYETTQYYYHTDESGNVLLTTDRLGVTSQRVVLTGSGDVMDIKRGSGWFFPYFFNGYRYDLSNGLYYRKGQLYNPQLNFNLGKESVNPFMEFVGRHLLRLEEK